MRGSAVFYSAALIISDREEPAETRPIHIIMHLLSPIDMLVMPL